MAECIADIARLDVNDFHGNANAEPDNTALCPSATDRPIGIAPQSYPAGRIAMSARIGEERCNPGAHPSSYAVAAGTPTPTPMQQIAASIDMPQERQSGNMSCWGSSPHRTAGKYSVQCSSVVLKRPPWSNATSSGWVSAYLDHCALVSNTCTPPRHSSA